MSITGNAGGPPVKAGVPLTDLGAGLFATVGILAAVEARHRTGKGQHVDTSLVDAGVALSVWEATEYFSGAGIPVALGSAHRMNAPYQAIRCADGYITLGGANERLFRRLCDVLGHPEWTTMPEFADNASRSGTATPGGPDRGHHLSAATQSLARAARSERHPVRSDQQLRAGVRRLAGPQPRDGGRSRSPDARTPADARLAAQDERHAADVRRRAPQLGEHTDVVLREAGYSDAEIAAMRASGAVS
jgi:formyl-CoA transferase